MDQLNGLRHWLNNVGDYVNTSLLRPNKDETEALFTEWMTKQPFSEDLLSSQHTGKRGQEHNRPAMEKPPASQNLTTATSMHKGETAVTYEYNILGYRLYLFQLKETNAENARLGNMASTRMGRVTQMLEENANDVDAFHKGLRALPALCDQVDNLNRKVVELERHFAQTELALACLERVNEAVKTKQRLAASDG